MWLRGLPVPGRVLRPVHHWPQSLLCRRALPALRLYQAATMSELERPSAWVQRFAPRVVGGGIVLDLACGRGRHTRYLLRLGYRVVAVDRDVAGLLDLRGHRDVEIIDTDLEGGCWPFGERRFDGIIVTNYLHRPHLAALPESLAPSGVLIYETFAVGHERHGRPQNPDFLLMPNELLDAFTPKLTIVAYEHGFEAEPKPAVRQRICAIRP